MTLFLVNLDVLVAPEPETISPEKCTPTVALLAWFHLFVDGLGYDTYNAVKWGVKSHSWLVCMWKVCLVCAGYCLNLRQSLYDCF